MAYISNKLTHWVGKNKSQKEQYGILLKILKEKRLLFGNPRWSLGKKYPDLRVKRLSIISFTDIPLSESKLHCKRYSKFGISFNKAYLVNRHATPVGYMQTPWIQGNINFIIKALKVLKKVLSKKGIKKWYFKGSRGFIKETATVDSLLVLFKTFLLTTEDYSGKKGFKYNTAKTYPSRSQQRLLEDYRALYFEREWRINYTTLLKKDLKYNIVEKGKGKRKKKYLKFDEKYVDRIIMPKKFIPQFNKKKKNIFQEYNKKNIPTIIAYEDLNI
jgi:hypothetical protein